MNSKFNSVPKIEGHAAFYTHLKNGRVDKARIIGLENDRFVEKILVGRKYWEAPIITSRICGICPTIHNVTATRAIEAACSIKPTDQTIELRKLMLAAQIIQSHSLHLYLLVLPDFVGVSSSFELQKHHPEQFKNAIDLKKYADKIIETIGGRAVHPIASVPGGFKSYPRQSDLVSLIEMSDQALHTAEETLRLFSSFKYPELPKSTTWSGLYLPDEYAFYSGEIKTSGKTTFAANDYSKYIIEKLKPYTHAKFGSLKGKIMNVGAIARVNLNSERLSQETKRLINELEIKLPLNNSFSNIIAQAIENYHFADIAQSMIKKFVKQGIKNEKLIEPSHFGKAAAACEAPRGTLFHYYELDREGYITKCDIITPTVQNLSSLEEDIKNLVQSLKNISASERNQDVEMLIRAFDPCITCATH